MLPSIPPGDNDMAFHRAIGEVRSQPGEQQTESGFAGIAGAHDRQPLTGPDAKIQTINHPGGNFSGRGRRVGKAQPFRQDRRLGLQAQESVVIASRAGVQSA